MNKPLSSYEEALQIQDQAFAAFSELQTSRRGKLVDVAAAKDRIRMLAALPCHPHELKMLILQQVDIYARAFPRAAGYEELFRRYAVPQGFRQHVVKLTDPDSAEGQTASLQKQQRMPFNTLDFWWLALSPEGGTLDGMASADGQSNFWEGVTAQRSPAEQRRFEISRACYFHGPVIKERLGAYFDTLAEDGPTEPLMRKRAGAESEHERSSADRFAEIVQLQEKLAQLDGELHDLDQKMVALRISHPERVEAAQRLNLALGSY